MDKAMPFRLEPFFSPRPWGKRDWSNWYADARFAEPVGEAWLTGPQCKIETGPWAGREFSAVVAEQQAAILGGALVDGEFPLLVKILAPQDNLSLQVHPDDAMAQETGYPRGKTECWYVLDAEPGATLALGMEDGMDENAIRAAIADSTLEAHMRMLPVVSGDMIFVDAGTVHGIGSGVTLLETQQTCDITYRLYDYGRPRELHVEQALHVMKQNTRAGKVQPQKVDGFVRLIREQYFTVDRFELKAGESRALEQIAGPQVLVCVDGDAALEFDSGKLTLERGKAVVIPAECATRIMSVSAAVVVRSFPGI